MVLTIILCFKVDYISLLCHTMSFNRTNIIHIHDNFCITKIKYIMYNVQGYRVLYNNVVRTVIC